MMTLSDVEMGPRSAAADGGFAWTTLVTGPLAGAVSAAVFAAVHALLIGPIWFFMVPMLIAGAVCGLLLAVTFGLLVDRPSVRAWVLYNATFVGLFALLGVMSVILYEPMTTIGRLVTLGQPPEHLFRRVLPLSIGFTFVGAGLIAAIFGRQRWHIAPALLTMVPLTLLLGLNISILGLVEIARSELYLVALTFGLIVVLAAVYAAVFAGLEWHSLRRRYELGARAGSMTTHQGGRDAAA